MRFLQRDSATGRVTGHFANAQSYATESVPDDHPDLVAFEEERERRRQEARAQSLSKRVPALEARIAALEERFSQHLLTGR